MHLRFILATYVLLTLAFAVPVYFARQLENPELNFEALFTWLVVAYSSLRLSLLAIRGEKRILSLTFWVFVYIWLGVAPMLQLLVQEFPLSGFYSPATPVVSTAIIFVGLVAFEIGCALSGRRILGYRALHRLVLTRTISHKRVILAGIISTAVAFVLVGYLGGPKGLFVARTEFSQQIVELMSTEGLSGFMFFLTLLRVPVFISFYVLLYRWVHQRHGLGPGERNGHLAMLLAVGVANFLINNPINSPRYWFGTMVISALFVVMPWRKNYSLGVLAVACVFLLLVVFPYTDLFRVRVDPRWYAGMEWNPVTEKADYDAYQQVMNTVLFVQENGHTHGRQLLGALCFWVPRGLWVEKPTASGQLVGEEAGYVMTNLSCPLWGEAYIDGGFLGVIFAFVIYGYYLRRIETAYSDDRPKAGSFVDLAVPVFAAYQFFFLRGALMAVVAYLVPMLGMLYMVTARPKGGEETPGELVERRQAGMESRATIDGRRVAS